MKSKITTEQAKAIAIIVGALGAIALLAFAGNEVFKFLGISKSDSQKKAQEEEAIRKKKLEDAQNKDVIEAQKNGSKLTRSDAYFQSTANTIEDTLSYDTSSALNRDEERGERAFLTAINSNADFSYLVKVYGIRPYKTLFGIKTSATSDLLSLLRNTLGDWRVKRMNEDLRKKGVTLSI